MFYADLLFLTFTIDFSVSSSVTPVAMAHLTLLLVMIFASATLSDLLIKDNAWHAWKEYYNKIYASDDEESLRYSIWINNLKMINQHNSDKSKSFTMEMNHLGDMVYILFINSFLCQVLQYNYHAEIHDINH